MEALGDSLRARIASQAEGWELGEGRVAVAHIAIAIADPEGKVVKASFRESEWFRHWGGRVIYCVMAMAMVMFGRGGRLWVVDG